MLHITSLVFIYLITGSLYLLATFIQFHLSTPTYRNNKSDLFFYGFGLFDFEV